MGAQPIPSQISKSNPGYEIGKFNTLLIDGSNLLELSCHGCKMRSKDDREVGGIYQFLLQVKLMLRKANFRYVYVFWDGDRSGQKRYDIYPLYKQNRDKAYSESGLSDYMREVNEKIKRMRELSYGRRKTVSKREKDDLFYQKEVIMDCLEELFVRQYIFDEVEADDLISFYVHNKKPNERIVIMSNDKDISQLISNDVILYLQSMKRFVNTRNSSDILGCDYRNIAVEKIICGDSSDNIKGIKNVGETTLLKNFPELMKRKVELDEIVTKAAKINEEREKEGKKPLLWAKNIADSVTDGIQGDKLYEINSKIINLNNTGFPMMTEESKNSIMDAMYAPIDPDGRSMGNLYKIIYDNGIEELIDEGNFSNFFSDFINLIMLEKKKC